MSDSVTKVTQQSWFGRLGASIKGVLIGVVLFLISFGVLWWNEGRAVKTASGLRQLRTEVATVDPAKIDPDNEGRAVHLSGKAVTDETLTDPDFGIAVPAIRLQRRAEMYQWEEESRTEERRKVGGGSERTTTYEYKKVWSERAIPSDRFQQAAEHENPGPLRVESREVAAGNVTLGAFHLPEGLVKQMDDFAALPLSESETAAIREKFDNRVTMEGNTVYLPFSANGPLPGAGSPKIGDLKVQFSTVKPAVVSVIARQIQGTFEPWRAGSGVSFQTLVAGTRSADEMIGQLESANTMMTWVLRLVGFVMMAFGIGMVFAPLAVVADVLPILGDLMRMGLGLFSLVIAGALSLVTIAVAWLAYRPVFAVMLLVVGAALVLGLWSVARGRKAKTKAIAGSPPPPPPLR
ncbi:MAG: TMEM43 family protein [Patescibacteria group bacterium]|nr:TMEM43 family protein [Patescibacteria group bacterium]